MPKSLHDSRQGLSEAIQSAISHLRGAGYSYKRIGRYMGYPEKSAKSRVSQFMNEGDIPPGFELMRLSQLASIKGYDELADHFSAPAKTCIPSTAGEAEANMSLLEENQLISVNVGQGMAAFNAAELDKARQHFKQSIAAHFDALKELKAFQAMQASRGDGAPTIMPNRAVATI